MYTTEPPDPSRVLEGNNITLEWRYNFGSASFRQMLFGNAKNVYIVEKFASDIVPVIDSSYKGRLLVEATANYTSITFLRVNRTDSTTYTLTITNDNIPRERARSQVKISVECKYENENKTI